MPVRLCLGNLCSALWSLVFRTCGGVFRLGGRYRTAGWLSGHECVLASVGFALESDEPAVVDGAVDEGGGHVGIAQDASPAAEFDVGGVDDAPCLVAVGDDLEEQAAAFLVDGHVAEFVDDQQAGLTDGGEFVVEPVVLPGAAQSHEQACGGEEAHGDVVEAGEPADGACQVGLAASDVAVEDEVLGPVDELEAFESGAVPVGRHLQPAPVVVVEGLGGGEAGLAHEAGLARSGALLELEAEPSFDQVEVGARGVGHDLAQHVLGHRQAGGHVQDAFLLGDGRGASSFAGARRRGVHRVMLLIVRRGRGTGRSGSGRAGRCRACAPPGRVVWRWVSAGGRAGVRARASR